MKIWSLALVQGITEAFPISSSAHTALLFGMQAITQGMDAILHLGSFLSLCLYFYKEILAMITGFFHILQKKPSPERHLFKVILVATLPCGLVGLVLHTLSLRPHGPCITSLSLCLFGGVLYMVDRLQKYKKAASLNAIPMAHAVTLGLFQVLSLVPGVSRLGICMIAGRLLGYDIPSATRMGFIMGIPVMASASLVHIPLFIHQHIPCAQLIQISVATLVINLPMIHFFLFWTRHFSIAPIALYRIMLGIFLFYRQCFC